MSLTATWASLHSSLKEVQVVENDNVKSTYQLCCMKMLMYNEDVG
jgi:hypothetical protein